MRARGGTRSAFALLAALFLLTSLAPGCAWLKRRAYEGGDRDSWQQPDRVVQQLALAPDAVVADIGAGGGYFTFRLADAVPQGRVFAVDVDADMTSYLAERAASEGRENVVTVLADPEDPGLPEPVDWVFVCNTFHHLPDPPTYFRTLRTSLRAGGRIAIVEYAPRDGFSLLGDHSTDKQAIVDAFDAAGYALDADHSFLDRQSFLVFAPAGS